MLPGALFEGPITIFARLDKDGDAAPAPGDIDGVVATKPGDQQVEIILNHLIGSWKYAGSETVYREAYDRCQSKAKIGENIAKLWIKGTRTFVGGYFVGN